MAGLSGLKGIADGLGHLGDRTARDSHIFRCASAALVMGAVAGRAADLHVGIGGAAAGGIDGAASLVLEGTTEGLILHDGAAAVDPDAVAAAVAAVVTGAGVDAAGEFCHIDHTP